MILSTYEPMSMYRARLFNGCFHVKTNTTEANLSSVAVNTIKRCYRMIYKFFKQAISNVLNLK